MREENVHLVYMAFGKDIQLTCEHGNEASGFVNCTEVFDQLRICDPKNNSAARS
jgi:hypothetical protein